MADSTNPLDQVAFYQAGKEITVDELFDAASQGMGFGRHASVCTGRVWGYYAGVLMISGTPTKIPSGTLTLTASATCYVRIATATGVIDFVTSAPAGWPGPVAGYKALYEIVVGTDAPVSWTDWRPTF